MKLTSLVIMSLTCFHVPLMAQKIVPMRVSPELISTTKNEYNYQISVDNKKRIFARANADFSKGKIYISRKVDGEWDLPKPILFSDQRFKDSDPWFSPSGNDIYFISNRVDDVNTVPSEKNYDIWYTRSTGDAWTAPIKLESVNTSFGEFGPQVHGDYLYFSSTRSGKNRLYQSKLLAGIAQPPELMSLPFNSPDGSEIDLTFSQDGKVAIWCSTRSGGFGKCDLYASRLSNKGWTQAENLGDIVNSDASEFSPILSANGAKLFFASSRFVENQEPGASDIYAVDVKDIPVLQKLMSTAVQESLLKAFGGSETLQTINSVSFTLEINDQQKETKLANYIYDFSNNSLMKEMLVRGEKQYDFVTSARGVRLKGKTQTVINQEEQASLARGLQLNFFNLLRAPNLALLGPENLKTNSDIHWFKLTANNIESPLLGIDTQTGRIIEVGNNPNVQVFELDYIKTNDNIIWPHRFIVVDQSDRREGRYSNVKLNTNYPKIAPEWMKN